MKIHTYKVDGVEVEAVGPDEAVVLVKKVTYDRVSFWRGEWPHSTFKVKGKLVRVERMPDKPNDPPPSENIVVEAQGPSYAELSQRVMIRSLRKGNPYLSMNSFSRKITYTMVPARATFFATREAALARLQEKEVRGTVIIEDASYPYRQERITLT
jgi:hypothetical protein